MCATKLSALKIGPPADPEHRDDEHAGKENVQDDQERRRRLTPGDWLALGTTVIPSIPDLVDAVTRLIQAWKC